ncbi:type II toxin-antitoxin system HipA family toxin [Spiribacter onubensis]|uniref:Type II toxin-antitoxin system HipA family toxin n=1 Tax=Spiribacter onubensis TaxID=3122420 RepID=A0ABV3SC91_9GAMM
MMTSSAQQPLSAYAWIWLPGRTEPVVAGRLDARADVVTFTYGRRYITRHDAIPIYRDLPLVRGVQYPSDGLLMAGSIRDAAPDAWGRRIIMDRLDGYRGTSLDTASLGEITYLLESGSDRIGALDFQRSADRYASRLTANADLAELMTAADRVDRGVPLSPELDRALQHGTSIGGARPKALIEDDARKFVAKFSSSADLFSVVRAEYIAMRLAALCGLDVAEVTLRRVLGRDVLLVQRFDRVRATAGWQRRALVSGLTLLGLDEMLARYASYEALAHVIRAGSRAPEADLRELFARLVFNILVGNTDDHARNHSAFWDGEWLSLSPAYDICPQSRVGGEASQAMAIVGEERSSRLASCLAAAPVFRLSMQDARAIADHQIRTIIHHWHSVCDEAGLAPAERIALWGRQFFNPFCIEGLEDMAPEIAAAVRAAL